MKNRKLGLSFFLLTLLPLAVAIPARADSVPAVINYQGKLYDPAGAGGAGGPITGVQQVEFRIYDALSGGTLIWGRRFPVSCVADGSFNVMMSDGGTWLGGVTNSLRDAFQGQDRFLELTVVGYGSAISPRQQLVSAPYSMYAAHAAEAQTAANGFAVNNGLTIANGGANVGGSAILQSNLSVNGATTLSSSLTVNSSATITGTLTVNGNVTAVSPSTLNGYGTIPIGGILLWSGSIVSIPDGWAICDGGTHNGHLTPDLRNQFVVGAGVSYAVGNTGGVASVTLTQDQMPIHSHSYDHGFSLGSCDWKGGGSCSDNDRTGYIGTYTSATAGSGAAHENRPPYYALAYIMRVK
jgi:hypothetical protein